MESGDVVLIISLASAPDRILREIAEIGEDTACRRPSPNEWCVIEVVVHLGDVEHRYRARLKRIASEDNLQVPAIWPRSMPEPLPALSEALASFGDERAETVAFLSALASKAWERPAQHATLGATTICKQVQGLIAHDENHLNQIMQTIELIGA